MRRFPANRRENYRTIIGLLKNFGTCLPSAHAVPARKGIEGEKIKIEVDGNVKSVYTLVEKAMRPNQTPQKPHVIQRLLVLPQGKTVMPRGKIVVPRGKTVVLRGKTVVPRGKTVVPRGKTVV